MAEEQSYAERLLQVSEENGDAAMYDRAREMIAADRHIAVFVDQRVRLILRWQGYIFETGERDAELQ